MVALLYFILFQTVLSYLQEEQIQLICRTENSIFVKFINFTNQSHSVQVYDTNMIFNREFTELPDFYEIENLKMDFMYRISVFYGEEEIATSNFKTLSNSNSLHQVEFANVTQIKEKEKSVSAIFIWTPVPEKICTYEILIWEKGSLQIRQIVPEINELYRIELEDLKYSKNYSFGIYPFTENDEGPKIWFNFTTPPFDSSLSTMENISISQEDCTAYITWTNPDYRTLSIISEENKLNIKIENETSVLVKTQDFGDFSVHLNANEFNVYKSVVNLCHRGNALFIVISILVVIIAIAFLTYLLVHRIKSNVENEIKIAKSYECDYEILRDRLEIYEVIGEGEFGVVHRASFTFEKGKKKEVAVKVVKEKATSEDIKQLEKEVEVMKRVGSHVNIVSLIGYCPSYFLLVVEYCSVGNLLSFLRNVWKAKILAQELCKLNLNGIPIENGVSNILYEKSDIEKKQFSLTIMDMISLSRQVALGMEYLSKNRVIHRDLAARNVLLTSNLVAKISDFGLSRDVYEENIYKKKTASKLPIKWMAIESLVHNTFTTQSDVWSFGVLLWEIMTLGCCPYPALSSGQICKHLLQGYRLEKPPTCSQQLYNLMTSCWDAVPQKRPKFSAVVQHIDSILEKESPHKYLELDCSQYVDVFPEEFICIDKGCE